MRIRKLLLGLDMTPDKVLLFAECGLVSKELAEDLQKNPKVSKADAENLYRISRLSLAGFTNAEISSLAKGSPYVDAAVSRYVESNRGCDGEYADFVSSLERAECFSFDFVSHCLTEHEKLIRGTDGLTKKERKEKKLFCFFGSIFIGIAVLNIIFAFISVIAGCSDIVHPKIDLSSLLFVLVLLIPTVIVLLCGIYVVGRYQRLNRWDFMDALSRRAKATVCLALATIIVLLPRIDIFLIMFIPVAHSETCDADDYMELDYLAQKRLDAMYHGLFPDEIPEGAEDVRYYYREEDNTYDRDFEIFAEWRLDGEAFDKEIDRVCSLGSMQEVFELGSYKCYSFYPGSELNREFGHRPYFFAFNRGTNTVRYVFCDAEHELYLDDPYFLNQKW